VKTVTMTMRGCPKPVHEALRKSAKANRRSLNQETLAWLEQQATREKQPTMTCEEAARILREANKGLSAQDRRQIAEGIEEARRRMAREHLH
jgi:Antitoxin FitA-like, ribbon-helix-helix